MRGNYDPDDLLGKAYDSRIARRLTAYLYPYKEQLVASAILITLVTVTDLALPWLFSRAIDEVRGDARLWVINTIGALFVVTVLVRFGAMWGQFYSASWLGNRLVFDLRNTMFRHLQRLSIGYIDKRGVGAVMTRIQNDVGVLQ